MTLNNIVRDLKYTIEYFKNSRSDYQAGRLYQAKKTLEQLRLCGVVAESDDEFKVFGTVVDDIQNKKEVFIPKEERTAVCPHCGSSDLNTKSAFIEKCETCFRFWKAN